MRARRILSMVLALALIVGVMAPCKDIVHAADEVAAETLNLEMVTAPVTGESYYLGAYVNGTMMYFKSGTVTQTAPYSLVTTEDKDSATLLTAEDPAVVSAASGFQLTYVNSEEKTLRLYCMDVLEDEDVAGQTGVMDTGNNQGTASETHNFRVELFDGRAYVTCPGADTVLVVKEMTNKNTGAEQWRMLFVPAKELENEGVYPAMLMQEHDDTHNLASSTKYNSNAAGHWRVCTADGCTAEAALVEKHTFTVSTTGDVITRTCSACQYKESVYEQRLVEADEAVIGNSYYLGANVGGDMYYFGYSAFTNTAPYSLYTRNDLDHNWTVPVVLESPEALKQNVDNPGTHTTGFQMTFTNPSSSALTRIYCMDSLKDDEVEGQTGVMDTAANTAEPYVNRHNFSVSEVNGVKVITSTGNPDHVLVAMKLLNSDTSTEDWRMLFVSMEDLEAVEEYYPVMLLEEHTHVAGTEITNITAETHDFKCWCGKTAEKAEKHTFGDTTPCGSGVSRSCTVCGYTETAYNQRLVVTNPVIGEDYYLAADTSDGMMYFRHGTATDSVPYSLVVTDDLSHNWLLPVTLEDGALLASGTSPEGGFQMIYTNPSTNATSRIYCYDVLKDATVAGQTGIMDTGINSASYVNRHNFTMQKVTVNAGTENEVTLDVLHKTGNNNVLVVKKVPQTTDGVTTDVWRMLGVPQSELGTEGVYPVMLLQEHDHVSGKEISNITDTTHSYGCWCGGEAETVNHTYGASNHDIANKVTTRTCTECGYVAAVHGYSQAQVKYPTIGETYNLVANVEGEILSFTTGGYTQTSPQSLITTTDVKVVTVQEALETGKGEFQLVYNNGTDDYSVYSTTAGLGLSKSSGYVSDPLKVSFSMEEVSGVRVLRAYGTQEILAADWSDTKNTWRIFPVEEDEIGTEGIYPVMLTVDHTEHDYDKETWVYDEANGTQSHACKLCGHLIDTLYGENDKFSQVTEPTIGDTEYYLAANVAGTLRYFRVQVSGESVTNTSPNSVYTTDDPTAATLVKPLTAIAEGEGEFQISFMNGTVETFIYSYNNNTGTSKTSNTTWYASDRASFSMDETDDGVQVIRKYSSDYVLVAKQLTNSSTNELDWRILGVEESELANPGVYPVMLMTAHEHTPGTELQSDSTGHYYPCTYCLGKDKVTSHSFHEWDLDGTNGTQSAVCQVCNYELKDAQSPHYDDVESKEELDNALSTITVNEEEALREEYGDNWAAHQYSVNEDGKQFYLSAEIDGERIYFRKADKTDAGEDELVSNTPVNSLYTTFDSNDTRIAEVYVTKGITDDSYVLAHESAGWKAVYINDEAPNVGVDTGPTRYRGRCTEGESTTVKNTYKARAEFFWDEANDRLYQDQDGVKYVLTFKKLEAVYGVGTVEQWRMVAVPESELDDEGVYPALLTNHLHNYKPGYNHDNENHWRICYCGYENVAPHNANWTMDVVPTTEALGHKYGTCKACKQEVATDVPYPVKDWGIALGEKLGVSFHLDLAYYDVPTFTVAGVETEVKLVNKGDGTCTAFVPLAAAQMADEVKLSVGEFYFPDTDETGAYTLEENFSIRNAANAMVESGAYSTDATNLINHMLAYGGTAQTYFEHNAEDLAGAKQTVESMPAAVPTLDVENTLSGVNYYGASLYHDSAIAIRFYFTAKDSVSGYTFKVNSTKYTPVQTGDKWYIEVPNILPKDLSTEMVVTVTKGTNSLSLTYNPIKYIARMYHNEDAEQEIKDLTEALYGYHTAAVTYDQTKNLSGIGFTLQKKTTADEPIEGVTRYKSTYLNSDNKSVTAHAIVIESGAQVELQVSAADAGSAMTVSNHFKALDENYDVLAMINGGFFDLNNNKTLLPYGMQIVDGDVKSEPDAQNTAHGNNWLGMTQSGKYVISNAAGYAAYAEGTADPIVEGIGGGLLLMEASVAKELDVDRDYRTAVGINADGDLAMVVVNSANYKEVCQIFVDLGMNVTTVLNLDGGGSTAMYIPGGIFGPTRLLIGEYPAREVADAVAIVKK